MMTLDFPYWVYGTIYSSEKQGVFISGAWINANDLTSGSNIVSSQADLSGQYIVDIQSIANNEDTIQMYYNSSFPRSFVLDVSGAAQLMNVWNQGFYRSIRIIK